MVIESMKSVSTVGRHVSTEQSFLLSYLTRKTERELLAIAKFFCSKMSLFEVLLHLVTILHSL